MSDSTLHGKSGVWLFLLLVVSLPLSHRLSAQSETHRRTAWMPDSPVDRVDHSNGYTMLSGSFTSVGKYTGYAASTDVATGQIVDESMPKVNGEVYDIISDGNGGWYIAGYFETVDTVRVRHLVHIRSDKSIDRTWKPNPDGSPTTMKMSGTTLFVGGYFNEIAGQARNYLASFETSTGALNAWNPHPNSYVRDIEISGTNVIVAGSFTLFGTGPTVTRTRLAAINATTGVPTAWAPGVNSEVTSIALDGTGVFAGGYFTTAGGSARASLARIDLTTGLATLPLVNLSSGGYVADLEISGGSLFIAGYFSSVNGTARNSLASVSTATGVVNTLNVGLSTSDYVEEIALDGTSLYLAGSFTFVSTATRNNAAAVNAVSGVLLNWDPSPDNSVNTILPTSSGVWLGGYFRTLNGVFHNGFVLIEEDTDTLWPFQLDLDGRVNTIAVQGNVLYIGGQFTLVNKESRINLAALNLSTGELTAWDPRVYGLSTTDPNAWVNRMEIKDGRLYIGGRFRSVNALSTLRPGLAAIDLTTGAATSWNPNVGDGSTTNQYVNDIDIVGDVLYAGGNFSLLNASVIRNNIAAINTDNAGILPWNPDSSGEIFRLRAASSTVYVVGEFGEGIGGAVRLSGVAALSTSTGMATAWNPSLNGGAYDVAIAGDNVYVGGYYSAVDNTFRPGLSSFAMAAGTLNDWTPDLGDDRDGGYAIISLAASTSRLFVAGYFREVGNERREYYAEYDLCPEMPVITMNGTTLSTASGGSLQWYANGQAVAGATSSTFEANPLEFGVYAVSSTQFGCERFSADATYIVTSLESLPDHFKAYPNPVEHDLTFELPSDVGNSDITVTDLMGRLVVMEQNTSTRTLSFAGYRPGIYLLTVRNGGRTYTKKIMKVK